MDSSPKTATIVEIFIYTKDTSRDIHEVVKRPVKGQKRRIIGQEMVSQGVMNWRKKHARECMRLGEQEPPNLYKANILKTVKKETLDEELNIYRSDKDDVTALLNKIKADTFYGNAIKDIGLNSFWVIYTMHFQKHVYKEFIRLNKSRAFVCVDATGGIVKSRKARH